MMTYPLRPKRRNSLRPSNSRTSFHALRRRATAGDWLQAVELCVTVFGVVLIMLQLRENNRTNQVAIRGQLYSTEAAVGSEAINDPSRNLTSLWAVVPANVRRQANAKALLGLVTRDERSLNSRSASELYSNIFGVGVFSDVTRREATADLRRLFFHMQANVYYIHNAFDYKDEGILTEGEWLTWKGLLREAHSHPILVTVIWQGYQNRYFSRSFGRFLQQELCSTATPIDVIDVATYRRGVEFVRYYYPEMCSTRWPNALPDY